MRRAACQDNRSIGLHLTSVRARIHLNFSWFACGKRKPNTAKRNMALDQQLLNPGNALREKDERKATIDMGLWEDTEDIPT